MLNDPLQLIVSFPRMNMKHPEIKLRAKHRLDFFKRYSFELEFHIKSCFKLFNPLILLCASSECRRPYFKPDPLMWEVKYVQVSQRWNPSLPGEISSLQGLRQDSSDSWWVCRGSEQMSTCVCDQQKYMAINGFILWGIDGSSCFSQYLEELVNHNKK